MLGGAPSIRERINTSTQKILSGKESLKQALANKFVTIPNSPTFQQIKNGIDSLASNISLNNFPLSKIIQNSFMISPNSLVSANTGGEVTVGCDYNISRGDCYYLNRTGRISGDNTFIEYYKFLNGVKSLLFNIQIPKDSSLGLFKKKIVYYNNKIYYDCFFRYGVTFWSPNQTTTIRRKFLYYDFSTNTQGTLIDTSLQNTTLFLEQNYNGFCWKIKNKSVVTAENNNIVIYDFLTNSTTIEAQLSTSIRMVYLYYYNSKYYYITTIIGDSTSIQATGSSTSFYEYNPSTKTSNLLKTFDQKIIQFSYLYQNCIFYLFHRFNSAPSLEKITGISVFDLDKKINVDTDSLNFIGEAASSFEYCHVKYIFYFPQEEENSLHVYISNILAFKNTLPYIQFPININGATYNLSENVIVDDEIKPANINFVLANGKEIQVSPVINNISGTIKLPNN